MIAKYLPYTLHFRKPSGTSRGVLHQKDTYYLILQDGERFGVGECGLLRGLSVDDRPDYTQKLTWVCQNIHLGKAKILSALAQYPSIAFGVEQAWASLGSANPFKLFPSPFTDSGNGISINGLVWMGSVGDMKRQISEKLAQGFTCIKMKIGAIDFESEYELLRSLRKEYPEGEIEIRVDANGAFTPAEALEKLKRLSDLRIHSIEQPIKAGQWQEMALLCQESPLPIALDEELIGVFAFEERERLLQEVRPQYLILKPSLIGGYASSEQWIQCAEKHQIGWWVTSALESNIGLNALAQWTYTLGNPLPQGLGTGSLYTNNIPSPLQVKRGALYYNHVLDWRFPPLI